MLRYFLKTDRIKSMISESDRSIFESDRGDFSDRDCSCFSEQENMNWMKKNKKGRKKKIIIINQRRRSMKEISRFERKI